MPISISSQVGFLSDEEIVEVLDSQPTPTPSEIDKYEAWNAIDDLEIHRDVEVKVKKEEEGQGRGKNPQVSHAPTPDTLDNSGDTDAGPQNVDTTDSDGIKFAEPRPESFPEPPRSPVMIVLGSDSESEECVARNIYFKAARKNVGDLEPNSPKRIKYDPTVLSYSDEDEEPIPVDLRTTVPQAVPLNAFNLSVTGINEVTQFLVDMKQLWESREFSDVILECSDGCLSAHKLILAARCSAFRDMFESGMTEVHSNVVRIEDVTVDVMEMFLEFVYTGCVNPPDMDGLIQLIRVADRYGDDRLKAAGFQLLVQGMAMGVGKVLIAANSYDAPDDIKCKIREYLIQNLAQLSDDGNFKKEMIENKENAPVVAGFTYNNFTTTEAGRPRTDTLKKTS